MKNSVSLVALVTIGLTSNAFATDKNGFYVTGKIGTSIVKMSD
ncbi:hypothetical protein [Providencia burhodogranariea]|nr:hypothetical protein [Providencia burhodogranariea]